MNMRWKDANDLPKEWDLYICQCEKNEQGVKSQTVTYGEFRPHYNEIKVDEEKYGKVIKWLDESSSPSPLKDVIEEMEKDLYDAEYLMRHANIEQLPQTFAINNFKKDIINKYLPKLKQIGEGSDDSIVNELNHIKRTCEGFEYVPSQTIIEMIDRILNKQ